MHESPIHALPRFVDSIHLFRDRCTRPCKFRKRFRIPAGLFEGVFCVLEMLDHRGRLVIAQSSELVNFLQLAQVAAGGSRTTGRYSVELRGES